MAEGLLQKLPNIESLLQNRATAQGGLETLLGTLASLEPTNQASPLASVGNVLVQLEGRLDIDVSGLSRELPAAMGVIQNALPLAVLEHVEAIEDAYGTARRILQENPLAKEVAEGNTLQNVALAVIEDALTLFSQRIGQLVEGMVGQETLDEISGVFAAIEDLKSDFPNHRDDLLPFLAEYLIGVQPDLLREPLQRLDAAYAVLVPLAEEELNQTVGPAREALASAFDDLVIALGAFDPADAAAYAELRLRLEAVESATEAAVGAVTPVYGQLQSLMEDPAWDEIFSAYETLLRAVTPEIPPFTMNAVVDEMAAMLEEVLAKFHTVLGVDDLTQRIEALDSTIRDAFATSALGQLRQTVRAFLEDVQDTIEGVPVGEIQRSVESMLERVNQELETLGIARIEQNISTALGEAKSFVTSNIGPDLTNEVRNALELVVADARSLGLDDLIRELTAAVNKLDALMSECESALGGHMDALTEFVSQLDTLSFKPISDEVIGEIEELRTRLREIDPNSLSDAERIALRAALAVLEEIDLEGQVISGLKKGYGEAESQVKRLLQEITTALNRLREAFDDFDPKQVLGPVDETLRSVEEGAGRLSGQTLVSPLREQVERLEEELKALSPGRLLEPLQEPYDEMMRLVGRLDPEQWTAPLHELYEQIDRLIDLVDVTPLLDELDRMRRELLENARAAITDALDAIDLPEPLQGFFDGMRPVLEDITDAIFGDAGTELRRISARVNTDLALRRLSEPLDEVFDDLLQMVGTVPQGELTGAMNAIREGVGVGLGALDPGEIARRFREGEARLSALDPRVLLGLPLTLPKLKLAFEAEARVAPPERRDDVVSVSARFEAAISLVAGDDVDSDLIAPLIEAHDALADALRRRIDALDASGVAEAYAALRESLDSVLPPFLRGPESLTHGEILAGIEAMRPSVEFDRVEEVLERFLQRIQTFGDALEPAINTFFGGLREVLTLVDPLDVKDAVEDVYDAVRQKARVLDPEALAVSIRENFFEPVTGALEDIDPETIKGRIDQTYRETLDAVSITVGGLLDDIAGVLEEELGAIREEIEKLLGEVQRTMESTSGRVKEVVDRLEQLVFVELLERLERVTGNLGVSFGQELDRVRKAFDEMLAAIPLGASGAASNGAAA